MEDLRKDFGSKAAGLEKSADKLLVEEKITEMMRIRTGPFTGVRL
jgi:hypothetical protein